MRLSLLLAPLLAVTACSPGGNDADDNLAAVNIDAIDDSADRPAPAMTASPSVPPGSAAPSGVPARPPSGPNEPPFTDTSAQGAAKIVQTYYAYLGAGNYERAWALWVDPDMSISAFEQSFQKFAQYRAEVGVAGRVEGAAGSRYVTVPVRVYGRLKDNRPFNMRGSVVLKRSEVDGATELQRRWRISSSDVNPRPDEAFPTATPSPQPTEDNRSTARYRCMDGSRIQVRYDPDNRRATVVRQGKPVATLRFVPGNSGIHYAGGGYDIAAKGNMLSWTQPGQPPLACTIIR